MNEGNADAMRVNLVKRIYRAFNARDVQALLGLLASEFEWHPNPEEPEQQVARTPQELIGGLRDRWEALERLHTEVEDVEEVGDQLLARVRHEAVVRGSEASLERREVHVWSFRGSAVMRLQEFPTREAALRALEA